MRSLYLFFALALFATSSVAGADKPTKEEKAEAKKLAAKAKADGLLAEALSQEYGCELAKVVLTPFPEANGTVSDLAFYGYQVDVCGSPLFVASMDWFGLKKLDDGSVRKRAPLEMSCPAGDLTWHFIDAKTRIVDGCGKRVTYVYTGDVLNAGTWSANLTSQEAAP